MKFKVGDKVRVIPSEEMAVPLRYMEGVYVITYINGHHATYPYHVENASLNGWFKEEELELDVLEMMANL